MKSEIENNVLQEAFRIKRNRENHAGYGDGYGDAGYGDQSYGEGPVG